MKRRGILEIFEDFKHNFIYVCECTALGRLEDGIEILQLPHAGKCPLVSEREV